MPIIAKLSAILYNAQVCTNIFPEAAGMCRFSTIKGDFIHRRLRRGAMR
jgi:hypothetical protein